MILTPHSEIKDNITQSVDTTAQILLARPNSSSFIVENGYYRPQIFSVNQGINPLATAATSLLTLAGKLSNCVEQQDINQLHEHLGHEIKAFTTRAQTLGCRSDTILVARYALCALLDEIILQTSWGSETVWNKYKMLTLFQQETNSGEHFYLILQRLMEEPAPYLDILEILYLCLSLGFVGKYQHAENGVANRIALMDQLYKMIRLHRGEISKALAQPLPQVTKPAARSISFSWWRITAVSGLLLLGSYMGLNYLLDQLAAPLTQNLAQIRKLFI